MNHIRKHWHHHLALWGLVAATAWSTTRSHPAAAPLATIRPTIGPTARIALVRATLRIAIVRPSVPPAARPTGTSTAAATPSPTTDFNITPTPAPWHFPWARWNEVRARYHLPPIAVWQRPGTLTLEARLWLHAQWLGPVLTAPAYHATGHYRTTLFVFGHVTTWPDFGAATAERSPL